MFVVRKELDGVIARDFAAAQAGKADGSGLTRAGDAVAAAHAVLGQDDAPTARRCLAEQQRGARWRIDLAAVVGLDDFDVPILAQPAGGFVHEMGEQGELTLGLPLRLQINRPSAVAEIDLGDAGRFWPTDEALARCKALAPDGRAAIVYEQA